VKVISNSSPLINFAALGRFDLLQALYATIVIPQAVYNEVVVAGQGQPHALTVSQAAWIRRESIHTPIAVQTLRHLGAGEAEAIVLATETPGSLVILDDRQARLTAHALGVSVIGTLGILLIAKRKGLLSFVAPEIDKLEAVVGFRITSALKARVLEEAGE
jgi:predicted nucleic acid-binding protein